MRISELPTTKSELNSQFKLDELRDIASKLGIIGYRKFNKDGILDEIVKALKSGKRKIYTKDELASMNLTEIKEIANKKGIGYSSSVKKFELVDLIVKHQKLISKKASEKRDSAKRGSVKKVSAKRASAKKESAKKVSAKRGSAKRGSAKKSVKKDVSEDEDDDETVVGQALRASDVPKNISDYPRDKDKLGRYNVDALKYMCNEINNKLSKNKEPIVAYKTSDTKDIIIKKLVKFLKTYDTIEKNTKKQESESDEEEDEDEDEDDDDEDAEEEDESASEESSDEEETSDKDVIKIGDNITIRKYTEKTYVILGDTTSYKDALKKEVDKIRWVNLQQKGFEGKKGWLFTIPQLPKVLEVFGKRISKRDSAKKVSKKVSAKNASAKKASAKKSDKKYEIEDDEEDEEEDKKKKVSVKKSAEKDEKKKVSVKKSVKKDESDEEEEKKESPKKKLSIKKSVKKDESESEEEEKKESPKKKKSDTKDYKKLISGKKDDSDSKKSSEVKNLIKKLSKPKISSDESSSEEEKVSKKKSKENIRVIENVKELISVEEIKHDKSKQKLIILIKQLQTNKYKYLNYEIDGKEATVKDKGDDYVVIYIDFKKKSYDDLYFSFDAKEKKTSEIVKYIDNPIKVTSERDSEEESEEDVEEKEESDTEDVNKAAKQKITSLIGESNYEKYINDNENIFAALSDDSEKIDIYMIAEVLLLQSNDRSVEELTKIIKMLQKHGLDINKRLKYTLSEDDKCSLLELMCEYNAYNVIDALLSNGANHSFNSSIMDFTLFERVLLGRSLSHLTTSPDEIKKCIKVLLKHNVKLQARKDKLKDYTSDKWYEEYKKFIKLNKFDSKIKYLEYSKPKSDADEEVEEDNNEKLLKVLNEYEKKMKFDKQLSQVHNEEEKIKKQKRKSKERRKEEERLEEEKLRKLSEEKRKLRKKEEKIRKSIKSDSEDEEDLKEKKKKDIKKLKELEKEKKKISEKEEKEKLKRRQSLEKRKKEKEELERKEKEAKEKLKKLEKQKKVSSSSSSSEEESESEEEKVVKKPSKKVSSSESESEEEEVFEDALEEDDDNQTVSVDNEEEEVEKVIEDEDIREKRVSVENLADAIEELQESGYRFRGKISNELIEKLMYAQVKIKKGTYNFSQIPEELSVNIKSKIESAVSAIRELQGRSQLQNTLLSNL